jgi:hypothetical protein
MLYVNMCDIAVDLFSRCYFKEYFFMPLIGLSGKTVEKQQKVQEEIGITTFSQIQNDPPPQIKFIYQWEIMYPKPR